VHLCMGW